LDALQTAAGSTIEIDHTGGAVEIYIRDTANFSGDIVSIGGREFAHVVGVFGEVSVTVDSSQGFRGTLVAPNAQISLNAGTHRGAFYGQSVTTAPSSKLILTACHSPVEAQCEEGEYQAEDMFQQTGGLNDEGDGWNIWDNGYIATSHTFLAEASQITVIAKGQPAYGVWPYMVVRVDGATIGGITVDSAELAPYTFPFNANAGEQEIQIAFVNDEYNPPWADRNLLVDAVTVDCVDQATVGTGDACASFCPDPQLISWTGDYQAGELGTGTSCRQVNQVISGINCSNFVGGKQLFINGTAMTCNNQNQYTIPAPVDGGYCVQSTAGDYRWASYALW
jgi:hypothetical protein